MSKLFGVALILIVLVFKLNNRFHCPSNVSETFVIFPIHFTDGHIGGSISEVVLSLSGESVFVIAC